jgi:hypothetical protein
MIPPILQLVASGVEVKGLTKADRREIEILNNPEKIIWGIKAQGLQ